MANRYSILEVEQILVENGVQVDKCGKKVKGGEEDRPERNVKGISGKIAGINIPWDDEYCQVRIFNDALYERIKTDSRLNVDNSVNFPVADFLNEDGKPIKYSEMSPAMQAHFEDAYDRVAEMKSYKNYKYRIESLLAAGTVFCIDHGAAERSNTRTWFTHIIILFTKEEMDVVLSHIIDFAKNK